jgi:hypothetical protein
MKGLKPIFKAPTVTNIDYRTKYHRDWQQKRVNFIVSLLPNGCFKNSTLLELGPFNGCIGNEFSKHGASVTCIEGRQENVERIKAYFPHLNVLQADLDTPEWTWGTYDVIVHWGVLYHLQNHHRQSLINSINHCKILLLESVVHDYHEPMLYYHTENGIDQSLTNVGGCPTTTYVERILDDSGAYYRRIMSTQLDAHPHCYSWKEQNTNKPDRYKRRMWIVIRKEACQH